MNRESKSAVVEEVAGQLAESEAVFVVDYRGITVRQVGELRTQLRGSDAKLRIVKNSLGELAADKAGQAELKPFLQGPTALALVKGDVAAAAKTLSDAHRRLGILEFKGGTLNGSALSPTQIQSIARLPSREVLIGQLVGGIAAPLTGLVTSLNGLIGGLAIALKSIADQGLVSGTAPAPAAPAAPAEPEAEAAPAADAPAAEPEADAAPAADAPVAEPEAEAAPAAEPEPEADAAPVAEAEPATENETTPDSPESEA